MSTNTSSHRYDSQRCCVYCRCPRYEGCTRTQPEECTTTLEPIPLWAPPGFCLIVNEIPTYPKPWEKNCKSYSHGGRRHLSVSFRGVPKVTIRMVCNNNTRIVAGKARPGGGRYVRPATTVVYKQKIVYPVVFCTVKTTVLYCCVDGKNVLLAESGVLSGVAFLLLVDMRLQRTTTKFCKKQRRISVRRRVFHRMLSLKTCRQVCFHGWLIDLSHSKHPGERERGGKGKRTKVTKISRR